jgi:hypothetical protein
VQRLEDLDHLLVRGVVGRSRCVVPEADHATGVDDQRGRHLADIADRFAEPGTEEAPQARRPDGRSRDLARPAQWKLEGAIGHAVRIGETGKIQAEPTPERCRFRYRTHGHQRHSAAGDPDPTIIALHVDHVRAAERSPQMPHENQHQGLFLP